MSIQVFLVSGPFSKIDECVMCDTDLRFACHGKRND